QRFSLRVPAGDRSSFVAGFPPAAHASEEILDAATSREIPAPGCPRAGPRDHRGGGRCRVPRGVVRGRLRSYLGPGTNRPSLRWWADTPQPRARGPQLLLHEGRLQRLGGWLRLG